MRIDRPARLLRGGGFVLLLVFMTAAALFPAKNVRGSEALELRVNNAQGPAGATVGITVSIGGLAAIDRVSGISGGQFELTYDPAVAVVENVRPGSLIARNFTFMPNPHFSENSIKVAWAAASDLVTADGDLCNITFTLRNGGAVNPKLKNIVIYDQDMQPLAVGTAVAEGSETGPADAAPGAGPEPENSSAGDDASGRPGEETGEGDDPAGEVIHPEPESDGPEQETAPGGDGAAVSRSTLKNPLLIMILAAVVAAGAVYCLLRRRR